MEIFISDRVLRDGVHKSETDEFYEEPLETVEVETMMKVALGIREQLHSEVSAVISTLRLSTRVISASLGPRTSGYDIKDLTLDIIAELKDFKVKVEHGVSFDATINQHIRMFIDALHVAMISRRGKVGECFDGIQALIGRLPKLPT